MKASAIISSLIFCLCGMFVINLDARTSMINEKTVTFSDFQNRNSITGFIFGESRTPLSNVFVELLTDTYSTLGRMRTNGSGSYAFQGLSDGQYTVRVLTNGTDYEEQSISVSLFSISMIQGRGAVSEQIDFYLKPRKKKNAGLLAAPGVLFVQEVPDEARKVYEAGISDLSNKKEEAGLAKLKQSLEIFPDYFLALDRLGTEYVMRGHYSPASVLLTKAVTINPRSFSSHFSLGLAAYRLNQTDEAIKHFKDSITVSSNSVNAHLWLGIALHSKSYFSEALTAMLQADKLGNGTIAEVHFQLARIYKDQKKFQKAADALELFLKYNPDAPNAGEIKQVIKTLRQKE